MKKIFYLLLICTFLQKNNFAQNFWQQTNGPYGPGYVTAISTGSNGKVYVALDDVGLYQSSDAGNSFSYVSGELTNKHIRSILINELGYIFVGVVAFPNEGILRSTDDGNTWIQELSSEYVRVMALDSDGFIYAGTNESGIFRSSDDGDTWTQIDIESTLRTVTSLESSPVGYVFAAGWKIVWSEDRALRSGDNGITWDALTIPNDIYITKFAFSNDGNIVAAFHPFNPADSSGFLLSSDNGNSWSRINYIKSYYGVYTILFDGPSNSFYAVVYNDSVWDIIKSTNYGNTWSLISSIDYDQPDIFCFDSNQEDRLFVGSVDGFKYSSDLGYNWIQSDSGIYATSSNNLTLLPNDRLFVGTSAGNFRLAEDKMNWLEDSGLVGSFITYNNGDYFLSNHKIYKSTDNGNSWITVFVPTLSFSATSEITKTSNGYIFSGGWEYGGVHGTGVSMIWRSLDNGLSWSVAYSNSGDKLIYTIASIPGDIILAGGNDGQIVRSTDLGQTWNTSNTGIPSDARVILIRTGQGENIFAGTANYGIFTSNDGGLTWNQMNNGLNSVEITAISINSLGKVFAGTSNGIFESTNNGNNWTSRNSGLLDVSILSLLCDSLDYLYVATMSTGVYRSMYPTTAVENEINKYPFRYFLSQNYPNPFNPATKISYQIPERGYVSLKVFNILGREVANLISEEKPAGSYEIEFEGSRLTSGIYFYRIKAGEYSETKKMILLR